MQAQQTISPQPVIRGYSCLTMSKTPKHILKLSTEEKREFLDSFDIVLTDCDGKFIKCIFG